MGLFGLGAEPKPGELLPGLETTEDAPPFAGFFTRLFALLIDGVALYAVAAFLAGSNRSAMLALNPWLPYLGLAVGLGYFWLANGPAGRGRTLGKALLGLHVVDRDGVSLGWGPASRRAAIHGLALFGLLGLRFVSPPYYSLAWPTGARYASLVFFTFLGIFCLTLALALAFGMAMHPWKRGWHDLWAGSFVTRDPTPPSFRQAMTDEPDVLVQRKLAKHVKISLPIWLLALATLCVGGVRQALRGDLRMQVEHATLLNRRVLPDGALAIMPVTYPSREAESAFDDYVRQVRQVAKAKNEAAPTTESLRVAGIDGRAIMLQIYARRGAFPKNGAQTADFQRRMQALREQAWPLWQEYRRHNMEKAGEPAPEARQFVAVVIEQAQAFVYGDARVAAIARGAAEPASGTLTFVDEPVAPAAPVTSDAPTTSSTAIDSTTPAATAKPAAPPS